jgi:integrase
MTRRALTDRLVASLSANGKSQHEYPDGFCPGLLLRAYASGRKVWDIVFRCPSTGKRARMWIGIYPAVGLAQARQMAMDAHNKLAQGKDPRNVEATSKPKSIAELIEDRLTMNLRGRKRTAAAIEHRANKYIIPIVGAVPVEEFRIDPHYNAVIDPVLRRNSPRMAGILFQDLRALMNFGIQRGVIEYSRIARVKRPDEPTYRTRYLTLEELKVVWTALPEVIFRSNHIPTILRLCLVTGQRLSEVAGMRRSETNLGTRLWTIPGARTKNKHEHVVPLSRLALLLIAEAMRQTNGDTLFPVRRQGL